MRYRWIGVEFTTILGIKHSIIAVIIIMVSSVIAIGWRNTIKAGIHDQTPCMLGKATHTRRDGLCLGRGGFHRPVD